MLGWLCEAPSLGASAGHLATENLSGIGHSLLYKLYLFIWNWFHVVSRSHDLGYVGPLFLGIRGGQTQHSGHGRH